MSAKQPKIVAEDIQILSINIFKAQLNTTEEFLNQPVSSDNFRFGIKQELAHNADVERSRCRLYFSLEGTDDNENPIGVTVDYAIEFHFHIKNFKNFLLEDKKGNVKMNKTFAATLIAMAYSTARGIIFERTRGTFFEGVLLPIIDPFKVLEENRHVQDAL